MNADKFAELVLERDLAQEIASQYLKGTCVKNIAEEPGEERKVRFASRVNKYVAASPANPTPRSAKTRVATGFVQARPFDATGPGFKEEDEDGAADGRRLRFESQVAEVLAASEANRRGCRPVRSRADTAAADPSLLTDSDEADEDAEAAQPDERPRAPGGVRWPPAGAASPPAQALEAGKEARGATGARPPKRRIETDFKRSGPRLGLGPACMDATVPGQVHAPATGSLRSAERSTPVKGRGKPGAMEMPSLGSICEGDGHDEDRDCAAFDEDVEEVEAASVVADGCAGRARPNKKRVATGAVVNRGLLSDEDESDSKSGEDSDGLADHVRFDNVVEECPAASTIVRGTARSAKGRVATGYARSEEPTTRGVRFDDDVVHMPSASHAGLSRPVKNRIATGFWDAEKGSNQKTRGSGKPQLGPVADSPSIGSAKVDASEQARNDAFVAELLNTFAAGTATARELRRGCSYAVQLGPAGAQFLPHLEALAESPGQSIVVRTTAKDAIKVIRASMTQQDGLSGRGAAYAKPLIDGRREAVSVAVAVGAHGRG